MNRQLRITALAAALAASTLVVACGEQEEATVGQRLDSTVTEVQSAGTQMGQDARQAAQEAQSTAALVDSLNNAVERISAVVGLITTIA